jgi:hypothetical protein
MELGLQKYGTGSSYDPAIKLPSEWSTPDRHQVSQHFFVAWFVDRIILQLFGLING